MEIKRPKICDEDFRLSIHTDLVQSICADKYLHIFYKSFDNPDFNLFNLLLTNQFCSRYRAGLKPFYS